MFILFIPVLIAFLFVVVNFLYFLFEGRKKTGRKLFTVIEVWTVLLMPLLFLNLFDFGQANDCCSDSAVFSPAHRPGIYILMALSMAAYLLSLFRKEVLPPLAELLLDIFLVLGLVINLLLCIHLHTPIDGPVLWVLGNIPIILLLLMRLAEHHQQQQDYINENALAVNNRAGRWASKLLKADALVKYPVLLLLLAPFVILLSLALLLFGQKPDSMIRAFTDTYKHGFSQLDHLCDNVECGGHFLCSVGANGHTALVKPVRYGERNGAKIICNRQLLVSNAFEDLLQEHFPALHRIVRRHYNKVGDSIHRYYGLFRLKIVSDIVYLLMKPLEWIFVLVLYACDRRPEDRIARQYLSPEHRRQIDRYLPH